MEGGGMSADEILGNKGVRLLYFAVLLVLVLLVVWHLKNMNDRAARLANEKMEAGSEGAPLVRTTAGAYGYQNRFGQVNTSTTVGDLNTPHNMDVTSEAKVDRMTAWRETPLFWDYNHARDNAAEIAETNQFICSSGIEPSVAYDPNTQKYSLKCVDGSTPTARKRDPELEHQTDGAQSVIRVQDAYLGSLL